MRELAADGGACSGGRREFGGGGGDGIEGERSHRTEKSHQVGMKGR